MIKYIAYCRKSTNEPDRQILSINVQVAELEKFAAKEKLIKNKLGLCKKLFNFLLPAAMATRISANFSIKIRFSTNPVMNYIWIKSKEF